MTALLDVNAIVALAWPNHVHHQAITRWFKRNSRAGWATCPVTESGFVRVSSNRRAIPSASTVANALSVLRELCNLPGHRFWSDDVSVALAEEVDFDALNGYRQVTDAHLLALAVRRGGQLVTFDQAISGIAPSMSTIAVLRA